MADKKVTIDVEAKDKGSFDKLSLNSKKAGQGIDDVATKSRTADRNIKGVAASSSSATKNFSKMAQGTGGLVGAYAVLAANVFAISAAFNFLKNAGDLAALQAGQEAYAVKTGQSMSLLSSRIQSATGDIIDFQSASQAAAIGRAAGLTSDQLTGLARIAKNASVALGRDLTDSFNRLTKGAIKAEPELLDELGIVLRLEKATNDYGASIGKAGDDLTTFERTQAVVNAVLDQGNAKFDDVGENVNQVARLGKAFDDLVKSIKTAIEPLATFASKVFADNIMALAAAFGILGLSITKAMIPAGPSVANLGDMAKSSKAALKDAAGSGATGKKIAAGDFSEGTLNAIDKASGTKSGKSVVVDQMKMTQAEFKKHTAIIRADHARMTAANTTGMKRYTAQAKAYLLGMQAEHGKVMGSIKAGTAALASGMSKVLNAVAIIGMISLAITMVKSLIQSMKDPALKALEENAKRSKEAFAEQNKEISNLAVGFEKGATGAETLVKQANLLSNFSFDGVSQVANSLQEATSADMKNVTNKRGRVTGQKVSVAGNDAMKGAIDEQIQSFELLNSILTEHGLETEKVEEQKARLIRISTYQAVVDKGAAGNTENYNAALKLLQEEMKTAGKEGSKMSATLSAQTNAIQSISNTAEGFDKFTAGLKRTSSAYDQFLGFNEQLSDSMKTLTAETQGQSAKEFFNPTDLNAIETILGSVVNEQGKSLTVAQIQNKLDKQRVELEKQAYNAQEKTLDTKIKYLEESRTAGPVEKATLDAANKLALAEDKIAAKKAEINVQDRAKVDKESTGYKLKLKQLELLEKERDIAKDTSELATATETIRKDQLNNKRLQEDLGIKQQLLALDEKALGLAKERLALTEKESTREMNRSLRAEDRGNAFSFVDADHRRAVAEKKQFDDLKVARETAIKAEKEIKDKQIKMEYALLAAKLAQAKYELQLKAEEIKISNPERSGELTALATSIGVRETEIQGLLKNALDLNADTATSNLNDLTDQGVKLGDAVDDLHEMSVIGDKLAKGFASEMTTAFTAMVDGSKSAKDAFKDMGASMLQMITKLIMEMIILNALKASPLGGLFKDGGISKDPISSAYGGVYSKGREVASMAPGGIVSGPRQGYPAVLHGTEAVVPLPKGRSIPVEMRGGGGQVNNINVSVAVDGQGGTTAVHSNENQGKQMGEAIAATVRLELSKQKRNGGMLSPYGAS